MQQQKQQQQSNRNNNKNKSSQQQQQGMQLNNIAEDTEINQEDQDVNVIEDNKNNEGDYQNDGEDDDEDPPLPIGGTKNNSEEYQQQLQRQQNKKSANSSQQQQQTTTTKTTALSNNIKKQSKKPIDNNIINNDGVDSIGIQGLSRQDESNYISQNVNLTNISRDINVSEMIDDESAQQIISKGNKSPMQQQGRREIQQQQQQHLKIDQLNRDQIGQQQNGNNRNEIKQIGQGGKITSNNNSNSKTKNSNNRGNNSNTNNSNINLNGNFSNILSNSSMIFRGNQQQIPPQQVYNNNNSNSNYNSANSRIDSQSSSSNNNINMNKSISRVLNNNYNVFNQTNNGGFQYGNIYGIMSDQKNDNIMNRLQKKNTNMYASSNNYSRNQMNYNNNNNRNSTLEEQFLDQDNSMLSGSYPRPNPTKSFAPLEMEVLKSSQDSQNGSTISNTNNDFFYSALPYNYQSTVLTKEGATFLGRRIILEFAVPYLVVFLLHVLLWGLQKGIEDYCFYGASNTQSFLACECKNFGSRFWTFAKQLLSWKLGVMVCKNVVLLELNNQDNKKRLQKSSYPQILESFIMFGAGISVDFIMVVILDLNEDWYFYVAMSIIGCIVTLHSVKLSQLSSLFSSGSSGSGLFLYDLNVAFLICFGYFVLPNIYSSLVTHNGYTDGRISFLYIYPLLEMAMEVVTNQVLDHAAYGQFFEYQLQLFILGLRVGIMSSVTLAKFEFWYLGVFFLIKTVVSTTGVLYINVRRAVYYSVPNSLRYLVGMKEIPEHKKGRDGFLLENLFWVVMFFWWIFTGTLVPGYVKSSLVIDDCVFNTDTLFKAATWYRGFVTWIFVLVGTVLSLLLNVSFRYDTIKWVGAPQHNIVENILTRMFGWYLFQIGLGIAYSFSIEDANSYSGF